MPSPKLALLVDASERAWSKQVLDNLVKSYRGNALNVNFREMLPTPRGVNGPHGVYPYPARLLVHIPRFLINCLITGEGNDVVMDPFCGSGTVALEALRAGCKAYSVDQNPLAVLITRAKTEPLDSGRAWAAFEEAVRTAQAYRTTPVVPASHLSKWYSVEAFDVLARFRRAIEYQPGHQVYLRLCLALAANNLSIRDPRIPVPVRAKPDRSANYQLSKIDAWEALRRGAWRSLGQLALLPRQFAGKTLTLQADARTAPAQPDWEPTLILTSPPYGAAQKYLRSSSLALGWLGDAPDGTAPLVRHSIGRERLTKAERPDWRLLPSQISEVLARVLPQNEDRAAVYSQYFIDMFQALNNSVKHLADGGHFGLVCGSNHVAGVDVPTHHFLADYLELLGLEKLLVLADEVRGRSLLTTRRGASGSPLSHEYIYVFRKTAGVSY